MTSRPLVRRDIRVDGVFDIETSDWDQFVCGGVYFADGAYELYGHEKEQAFVDRLLSVDGNLWAHNGGKFDAKWLLDHVARRGLGASITPAGSRIVAAAIGKTRLYDSKALVPISLKDFTKGQGVEKAELQLPCKCGDDCGGYCSISRKMPKAQYAQVTDYLELDCKSLFNALDKLQGFAAENDLDLGATVGSSAWRNVKRLYGIPDAKLSVREHVFARGGYYGGRVQLPMPGYHSRVFECDVNSMYPWALSKFALPTGRCRMMYGESARRASTAGRPGLYSVIVECPEMHLPPLPFRYGEKRTAYPWGTFGGTWALPELQAAESLGCKITPRQALVFDGETFLFKEWCERLFALRRAAPGGKSGPLGTWVKFVLNSLTGKFGSNPDHSHYELNPERIKGCKVSAECKYEGRRDCGRCCKRHCNARCGAMAQVSEHIYLSKRWRLDECSHVEWSAYLTSQSRVAWGVQARAVDDGTDVVNGDTDSLFTLKERTENMGSALGEWEPKGVIEDMRGLGPKCYTGRRLKEDGEWESIVKAKGLRVGKRPLMPGELYEKSGIVGFKLGAREGKLFQRWKMARKLARQYGDRIPLVDPDTLDLESEHVQTRAPAATELGAEN